jgi:hypothetical protein
VSWQGCCTRRRRNAACTGRPSAMAECGLLQVCSTMPPTMMSREFIAHSTKMLHFPARLKPLGVDHDLSLAVFITNIAESDFRYTQVHLTDWWRIFDAALGPQAVDSARDT